MLACTGNRILLYTGYAIMYGTLVPFLELYSVISDNIKRLIFKFFMCVHSGVCYTTIV